MNLVRMRCLVILGAGLLGVLGVTGCAPSKEWLWAEADRIAQARGYEFTTPYIRSGLPQYAKVQDLPKNRDMPTPAIRRLPVVVSTSIGETPPGEKLSSATERALYGEERRKEWGYELVGSITASPPTYMEYDEEELWAIAEYHLLEAAAERGINQDDHILVMTYTKDFGQKSIEFGDVMRGSRRDCETILYKSLDYCTTTTWENLEYKVAVRATHYKLQLWILPTS